MNVKQSARGAVSKTSMATSPAVSAATQATSKSSILKSTFAPSRLQLSLFASVIQAFDSQHLRIHDTTTGRLRCEHAAGPGTKITSLDWGYYGSTHRDQHQQNSKKKRKRTTDADGSAVVAFGTSQSEICMFSPSESKIVGKLFGPHERGVKDFKFYGKDYLGGWSIGGDGKLVQWDLVTEQAIRSITLPDSAVSTLAPSMLHSNINSPQIICASSTPYAISLTTSTSDQIDKFDSFKNTVHSIIRSSEDTNDASECFLAADTDRYINLYGIESKRLLRNLVVNSAVEYMSLSATEGAGSDLPSQLLAVTTHDGLVELFSTPFQLPSEQHGPNGTIKSKRKNLTRKSNASIKLIRPDTKGIVVQIFQAFVQGPDVVIASTDGGVDVAFQKVRWQDEVTGELLFDGMKEVARSKSATSLRSANMNGVKDVANVNFDESKVVVGDAGVKGNLQVAAIEISSEEEGEDDKLSNADRSEQEEDLEDLDAEMADVDDVPAAQGQTADTSEAQKEKADTEPTFGELLAAKNPDSISIADALVPTGSSGLVATAPEKGLSIPSGVSFSTVLTQSLRTNDQNLLESCFHVTDLDTIRLTLQRLDSSLAGVLLQKLAERLSSRPGRYGHLLVWVQWTCIAHGGVIAGRPDVSSKIKTLYGVLSQRSKSLDNLLLLKGKLDMLEAQLNIRRQLKSDRGPARDPDDEEGLIYIEGQDDDDFSSDEDEANNTQTVTTKSKPIKKSLQDLEDDTDSEDDEDMPMTNGILHSDGEGSKISSDDEAPENDDGGLVDDEAVESGADSHPSDEEDESEEEEEEDSDEAGSEMDSFINDDSIEDVDSASEIDIDDTLGKPPSKKTKRA